MNAERVKDNDEIVLLWTELYLNQKMSSLEKRIYDWWVSEGFFYVSNFKETPEGTRAELMLLLGDSADNLVAANEFSKFSSEEKVKIKSEQGWNMIPFGDHHYILKDTKENRLKIQLLLEENIRYYSIVQFCSKKLKCGSVLKSVIIEVKRRKETND